MGQRGRCFQVDLWLSLSDSHLVFGCLRLLPLDLERGFASNEVSRRQPRARCSLAHCHTQVVERAFQHSALVPTF